MLTVHYKVEKNHAKLFQEAWQNSEKPDITVQPRTRFYKTCENAWGGH